MTLNSQIWLKIYARKKLIEKAIRYLQSSGSNFKEESIEYLVIKKDAELPDGTKKDMHVISYLMWIEGEAKLGFVRADARTDLLEFHITPHYFEEIVDEF